MFEKPIAYTCRSIVKNMIIALEQPVLPKKVLYQGKYLLQINYLHSLRGPLPFSECK